MEKIFRTRKEAAAFAKKMECSYGYRPAIFHFEGNPFYNMKDDYRVVVPRGLIRIRR